MNSAWISTMIYLGGLLKVETATHVKVSLSQRDALFFVCLFCLLGAALAAYGGSQARGLIGVVAAGLCQSHSNARSEPFLQPTPQLMATLDP